MPRFLRTLAAITIGGLVVSLAAGCGGDGDDEKNAATTTAATSAPKTSSSTAPAGKGPAVPSVGCETSTALAVREEKRTIDIDGNERYFLLTNPVDDAKTPRPLVLDLHGLAEGAEVHTMMSAFSDKAEKEGFAVAFPNGTGSPVRWDIGLDGDTNADLGFIIAILDTLGKELCLDESRIYATGLSNGAMMSSTLGCVLSDRIAAIAPVAGVTKLDGCDPDRPMPVLAFHGTADDILQFNGGVGPGLGRALGPAGSSTTTTTKPVDLDGEGYPATVAAWAEHNGCEPEPREEDVSEEVLSRVYDCPEGADVEFFIIKGGGHTWPGSDFSKNIESIVGPTTFDIIATDEIWEFFERFQLEGNPPEAG